MSDKNWYWYKFLLTIQTNRYLVSVRQVYEIRVLTTDANVDNVPVEARFVDATMSDANITSRAVDTVERRNSLLNIRPETITYRYELEYELDRCCEQMLMRVRIYWCRRLKQKMAKVIDRKFAYIYFLPTLNDNRIPIDSLLSTANRDL
jgi:hypothetical protein